MISFSIITVTWQAAGVIQPTLDSVLAQDFPDVEHILDSSRTMEENSGHTVKVVSEKDKGLYDAMNKGLRMATGRYVLFLNAGDRLAASDTLTKVAEVAEVGDGELLPAVLYGDTDVYDADGQFVGHRHLSVPNVLTWRSFQHGMVVCHQAFYALTEIAQCEQYDQQYRLSADVDWCIRVMREGELQGRCLRNVHAVVCHYLEGGMSIQNHRASLIERFRIMRKYYGLLPTVARHVWFFIRQFIRRL